MHAISRERGTVKPGAHRFHRLMSGLGFHSLAPAQAVLVTGTNGKGTVCAFLEAAFRGAGLKTGLYTSPHLVSVEERIRINGIPISPGEFEFAYDEVQKSKSKSLPDASEFELLTGTAAFVFHKKKVDVAVIEIGLGGLLDSTNATAPTVSVLTGVGIDHTEFLGSSLSSIARDKSFISRRNTPFIVGPLPEEAQRAAEESARITGAQLIATEQLPPVWENVLKRALIDSSFWMKSNVANLRVALTALWQFENATNTCLNKENIVSALRSTLWPGRFDVRTKAGFSIIFDGAHNTQGFEFFEKQFLESPYAGSKPTLIFASLADKPWKDTILRVLPHTNRVVVTQVQSERAVPADAIQNHIRAHSSVSCATTNTVADALQIALQETPRTPILVLGSLALIGEAMENLGLDPFEKLRNPS